MTLPQRHTDETVTLYLNTTTTYYLQPLESLGHLANVTLEKDVKKGLTPLIYSLL